MCRLPARKITVVFISGSRVRQRILAFFMDARLFCTNPWRKRGIPRLRTGLCRLCQNPLAPRGLGAKCRVNKDDREEALFNVCGIGQAGVRKAADKKGRCLIRHAYRRYFAGLTPWPGSEPSSMRCLLDALRILAFLWAVHLTPFVFCRPRRQTSESVGAPYLFRNEQKYRGAGAEFAAHPTDAHDNRSSVSGDEP